MGISGRNKKRILIFLLAPVLAVIPFLTDDIILRAITSGLLVIYIGFIIFLRDSVRQPAETSEEEFHTDFPEDNGQDDHSGNNYDTDEGEEFTIVSPKTKVEVLTSDTITSTQIKRPKSFFKPNDLKETYLKVATEPVPKEYGQDEQFSFVLEKVLTVVKESYFGYTALFFWYNKKKGRLTLEKFVSASEDITEQKFNLEDDILSEIVNKEEPELLSDINPSGETDVIRYYTKPQGIKSFVGVPLFYGKTLAGILAVDAKEKDAFGIETIYSLGRFIRVISILINLFEENFRESQSEQRLNALLSILSSDKKFENEKELFKTLENTVKDLIHWDAFTFVYYDPENNNFKTSRIFNKTSLKYVGENLEIVLEDTYVGRAITSGLPVKIDDTSMNDFPRYSKSEDISFDGAFMVIPLVYQEQVYGALCFESLKKGAYSTTDVNFIKASTKFFGFIVYSYSTQSILQNLLSVDTATRLYNKRTFVDRITSEMYRASEMETPSALAIIRIDDFLEEDSLFEDSPFPKVLAAVSEVIRSEMTPFHIAGRIDDRIFAVYFFNLTSKDAFLWSEKLRIQIARKPISVLSKQTTFTVSIGVASATGKTDVQEIIDNAGLALNKALEKGGNTVKSIN